ncbi:hypothetical protein RIF29_19054 [Crotalaria pallida]|uniref:Uncharacterized protein n=1 Tax=Crotalaria pallida TaxID=3830 RepID=A0AAN9I7E6_CROPI
MLMVALTCWTARVASSYSRRIGNGATDVKSKIVPEESPVDESESMTEDSSIGPSRLQRSLSKPTRFSAPLSSSPLPLIFLLLSPSAVPSPLASPCTTVSLPFQVPPAPSILVPLEASRPKSCIHRFISGD